MLLTHAGGDVYDDSGDRGETPSQPLCQMWLHKCIMRPVMARYIGSPITPIDRCMHNGP